MKTLKRQSVLRSAAVALLAGAVGAAMAGDPKANDPNTQEGGLDKIAERESAQPASDTWITTKVKSDLLVTEDVSGLELNVETVDGVVSLSGEVDNRTEADRAVAVARGIEGVRRVDASGIKVGDTPYTTP